MELVESLVKCRGMWNWLADNPTKTKKDYLGFIGDPSYISGDCYCCEYLKSSMFGGCDNCPLFGLWANSEDNAICTASFFDSWDRINILLYDSEFFALCIVEACEYRLKDFDYAL